MSLWEKCGFIALYILLFIDLVHLLKKEILL